MDREKLEFDEYQQKARDTNRIPYSKENAGELTEDIIPLLGLAGEAGDLLTEYKKRLRDGDSYVVFKDRVKEELGDIIWYVSNFADRFDLKLSEIVHYNLRKTSERFNDTCSIDALDVDLTQDQRFPQTFEIEFREIELDGHKKIQLLVNGNELPPETTVGAALTDNAYKDDGYKFHDSMHLAFVAILGWSPVMRKLLKEAKVIRAVRDGVIDEVEDGGRAKVIDEGLIALIFSYASKRNLLNGIDTIDYSLLRTIKEMTDHLEVSCRSPADWQKAIIDGFSIWRKLQKNNGGRVYIDRQKRLIEYIES